MGHCRRHHPGFRLMVGEQSRPDPPHVLSVFFLKVGQNLCRGFLWAPSSWCRGAGQVQQYHRPQEVKSLKLVNTGNDWLLFCPARGPKQSPCWVLRGVSVAAKHLRVGGASFQVVHIRLFMERFL